MNATRSSCERSVDYGTVQLHFDPMSVDGFIHGKYEAPGEVLTEMMALLSQQYQIILDNFQPACNVMRTVMMIVSIRARICYRLLKSFESSVFLFNQVTRAGCESTFRAMI